MFKPVYKLDAYTGEMSLAHDTIDCLQKNVDYQSYSIVMRLPIDFYLLI